MKKEIREKIIKYRDFWNEITITIDRTEEIWATPYQLREYAIFGTVTHISNHCIPTPFNQ